MLTLLILASSAGLVIKM